MGDAHGLLSLLSFSCSQSYLHTASDGPAGHGLDAATSYSSPKFRSRNQSYMRAVSMLSQASCVSQVGTLCPVPGDSTQHVWGRPGVGMGDLSRANPGTEGPRSQPLTSTGCSAHAVLLLLWGGLGAVIALLPSGTRMGIQYSPVQCSCQHLQLQSFPS